VWGKDHIFYSRRIKSVFYCIFDLYLHWVDYPCGVKISAEKSKRTNWQHCKLQLNCKQIEDSIPLIGSFSHTLTHRIIEFQVFTCEWDNDERFQWYALDSIDRLSLASAQRKVLDVHCKV
tara:strand:+ start:103 stop:462 length:360 start_codon:yes stop_codon:yes gene_type:complete